MKYVVEQTEFIDAMGNPCRMINPDHKIIREWREKERVKLSEARKEARENKLQLNQVIVDSEEPPMIEGTFAQAIMYFANEFPWDRDDQGKPKEPAKAEDIDNAILIIRAFKNPIDGYYEIAEEPLNWLIDQLSEWGGRAFTGTTSGVMRELLSGDNISDGLPPRLDKVTSIGDIAGSN